MTYFSGFSCLLGLTILLLQTIFVSKKAVNNEKWKAQNNSFDSFDRGQKNKRLTEREARLTLKMGVSVFRVFRTNENSLIKCAAQQNVSFFVGFCFGF